MKRLIFLSVLALLWTCGGDDDGGESTSIIFPHTLTINAEEALVMATGEIIDHADFKAGDLVVWKSGTARVTGRCPEKITACLPLRICRPSLSSLPTKFSSFDEVCDVTPEGSTETSINNVDEGMGFTVALQEADSYARVWVKKLEGAGAGATLTLVYEIISTAP